MKFAIQDPRVDCFGLTILERLFKQTAYLIREGELVPIAHVSLEDFEMLISILCACNRPGWTMVPCKPEACVRMFSCGQEIHVWPRADLKPNEVDWAERGE